MLGAARGQGQKERAVRMGVGDEGPRARGPKGARFRGRDGAGPRGPRLERRVETVIALVVCHARVGAGGEKHARHAGVAHPAGAEQRGVVVVVLNVVPAAVGEEQRDQSHVPLLGRARERRRAKLAAVAWVCAVAQQALGVAQVSPGASVKEGLSGIPDLRQPRARPCR